MKARLNPGVFKPLPALDPQVDWTSAVTSIRHLDEGCDDKCVTAVPRLYDAYCSAELIAVLGGPKVKMYVKASKCSISGVEGRDKGQRPETLKTLLGSVLEIWTPIQSKFFSGVQCGCIGVAFSPR